MKRDILSLSLLFFILTSSVSAQLFLPKFTPPVKQELFSSEHEESSPFPFNNGKGIYYNRTYLSGKGENIEITGNDFWISTVDAKGWEKPYRVLREGEIPDNNILVGVSSSGNRMYLLNTTLEKKVFTEKLIYVDKVGKNKWSKPVEVVIPGFTIKQNYIHFYVNPEETAILVSIPPKDNAPEDIFVSLKDTVTNQWSSLINVGQTINTARVELASFLSRDLKTLYFSSEGHGGYGASDIFSSYRLDDSWTKWTEPVNLGESINSKDYEAGYVVANGGEVYFVSDRDDIHNSIYKATITGEMVLANDSVRGKFVYRGLPADNISLIIEDEYGNIVDELITDEYGNFQFAQTEKIPSNYIIRIKGKEKKKYIGSKIYLTDKDGKQLKRFVYTDAVKFVASEDVKSEVTYEGIFNYKKSPLTNAGLVVVDESSFHLDTIYTDDFGKFKYDRSKYDEGLNIVPLDIKENDYHNVELQLMDKQSNSLFRIVPGTYQKLIKDAVVEIPPGVDPIIKEKNPPKAPVYKESTSKKEVIWFLFNEYGLTAEAIEEVSTIAQKLKSNTQLKVNLVGHTDNSGDEKINKIFGQLRADAIKRALLRKGVDAQRISTSSEGETKPMVSNDTRSGRIKNRRVEATFY